MNVRMNHRGHREEQRGKGKELRSIAPILLLLKNHFALLALPFAVFLCVLCGSMCLAKNPVAKNQSRQPLPPEKRISYQIKLALDFEKRTYTGAERVHWVNRGDHPTSVIYFHLYSNMRAPDYVAPTAKNDAGSRLTFRSPLTHSASPHGHERWFRSRRWK